VKAIKSVPDFNSLILTGFFGIFKQEFPIMGFFYQIWNGA
jgi:hypothetical protein